MNDETSSSAGNLFAVERITKATLSQFSGVLQAAARALEQRGQPLWSQEELEPATLLQYLEPELYLGFWNGQPVASMILVEEDPGFWPNVQTGKSLFIHKLAVVPSAQGLGLATEMLRFALSQAKTRSKQYLRLDCDAQRPKLRHFYLTRGFTCVERRSVGTFDTAFYEQPVGL